MSKKYDLNQPKLKKIAIIGSQCQGKSTLIKDMMVKWPQLSTPEKSYRDIITERGLKINKDGDEPSQLAILDVLSDQVMNNYGKKKIVFDRCPIDNLVYSIWLNEKHPDRMSDAGVKKTIAITKECMKFLDAIFFIPITSIHKVPITPDALRDIDPEYIEEIDNIFKSIIRTQKLGVGTFFPLDDCPPIIEIFGDRETRIKMLEWYITDECEFVSCDDNIMNELTENVNSISISNIIPNITK